MNHSRKDTSMLLNIIVVEFALAGFFAQLLIAGSLIFIFWWAWRDQKQHRGDKDLVPENAFTRWYKIARQQNPSLTFKKAVAQFLEQETRSNSGSLEEDNT